MTSCSWAGERRSSIPHGRLWKTCQTNKQEAKAIETGKKPADFHAGDVLLFGMYMMHASTDNHSRGFRLSSDTRYQLDSEPVDERWVGKNPPGHGPSGKRGMIC